MSKRLESGKKGEKMKEYILCKLKDRSYDVLILCLSHESVLTYYEEIQNEALIQNNKGYCLIDQLLVTGNEQNRFILIPYIYGLLDFANGKAVSVNQNIRKLSVDLLSKNITALQDTILTDSQQKMVLNKVAI